MLILGSEKTVFWTLVVKLLAIGSWLGENRQIATSQ
jgi:hypothetical protein